jgi:DNA-binding LacI/PurR family transcriptional regulator
LFPCYHVFILNSRRPVTLKEIAERVGVGASTASVVLNGAKSGTKVSAETRRAILQAAQELNYRPNALARSLRCRRTGIVGFFSGYEYIDPRNQYIAEVLAGLQTGCARHGLNLLLYTPHSGHPPAEVVGNLEDGRLDGLVITARPEHPINSLLAGSHLPVVAIADRIPGLPCVVADAAEGGRLQARHLFERGHRRVLYVPSDYPFPSVEERQRSFMAEAAQLGMEVVQGGPVSAHLDDFELPPEIHLRLVPDDLEKLKGPGRATAVQCWDDTPAYRIASQLADLGYRVPFDVAVSGYNGCAHSAEPRWNLTTVRADWPSVAAAAVEVLHACIEGLEFSDTTVSPVELIIGATT